MSFVPPVGVAIFALAELVSWIRRKPPISGVAPTEPGTSLGAITLAASPPPARPRVWWGTSGPTELSVGDRVAFWTRVEPMTPDRTAQLGAVVLAVQIKSGGNVAASVVCPMHKPGGNAWTELCGANSAEVCLRTATECVLTTPAAGSFTVEASVEWFEGSDSPKAATIEPFVQRAR